MAKLSMKLKQSRPAKFSTVHTPAAASAAAPLRAAQVRRVPCVLP